MGWLSATAPHSSRPAGLATEMQATADVTKIRPAALPPVSLPRSRPGQRVDAAIPCSDASGPGADWPREPACGGRIRSALSDRRLRRDELIPDELRADLACPVPGHEVPAGADRHPLVGHPAPTAPLVHPVAAHPYVATAIAIPTPVAWRPYVADARRRNHDNARRWRRDLNIDGDGGCARDRRQCGRGRNSHRQHCLAHKHFGTPPVDCVLLPSKAAGHGLERLPAPAR